MSLKLRHSKWLYVILHELKMAFMTEWRMLHPWWHRSCCPSWTWGCSRHCPSKWTRSSWLTSRALRSRCHIPRRAQRGPGRLWCYLKGEERWRRGEGRCFSRKGALTTGRLIVDTVTVEDKGAVRSVDADRHRPVFEESQLQGLRVPWCDVGVALDGCNQLWWVHVAETILFREKNKEIWFICPLWRNKCVLNFIWCNKQKS